MMFYGYYEGSEPEIRELVHRAEMGRLVTVGGDGLAHVGLYPFTHDATRRLEIHLNRRDEQVADLRIDPRCVFELDEVLAVVPSHWIDPENAVMATAYHRTVVFDCVASLADDPEVVARQQARMMERYQPEGGYRPVAAGDALYARMLGMLTAVDLEVVRCRAKFKLAQNRPPDVRRTVAEHLRRRARPRDGEAATSLEATIAPEPQPDGM